MRRTYVTWIVTLSMIMIMWMGCASSSAPPAYYGLQATTPQADKSNQLQMTIGVGPVQLPDYLDRSAIVTRLNPTRLEINTSHRWAGSLQSEILRVLAANLKNETAAQQVAVFPWGSDLQPDVRFRVAIHAFEGRLADQIHLRATWSLTRQDSDDAPVTHDSEVVEAVTGDGFEALAEAMGRALAVMSRDMAAALDSTEGQDASMIEKSAKPSG